MKKSYIKPSIEVIKQIYSEKVMLTEWSTGIGTDPGTGVGPASKPGGEWGNIWDEPVSKNDNWNI